MGWWPPNAERAGHVQDGRAKQQVFVYVIRDDGGGGGTQTRYIIEYVCGVTVSRCHRSVDATLYDDRPREDIKN